MKGDVYVNQNLEYLSNLLFFAKLKTKQQLRRKKSFVGSQNNAPRLSNALRNSLYLPLKLPIKVTIRTFGREKSHDLVQIWLEKRLRSGWRLSRILPVLSLCVGNATLNNNIGRSR